VGKAAGINRDGCSGRGRGLLYASERGRSAGWRTQRCEAEGALVDGGAAGRDAGGG
jgi:hypothetical protein